MQPWGIRCESQKCPLRILQFSGLHVAWVNSLVSYELRTLRDGKIIYSKGNDHVIDAVRRAMLVREEGNLDPIGEETVSLKPVFTDPVFI